MSPISSDPVESLGVQTLLLNEGDGLLQEDGDRVLGTRHEVVERRCHRYRVRLQLVLGRLLLLLLFGLLFLLLQRKQRGKENCCELSRL